MPLIKKIVPKKKQPTIEEDTNDEYIKKPSDLGQKAEYANNKNRSSVKLVNPIHEMETGKKWFSSRRRDATTSVKWKIYRKKTKSNLWEK